MCKLCPWSFSTARGLRRHTAVHSDKKPFVCNVCPKAYKYADDLKHHLVQYHDVVSKKARPNKTCETCGKGFPSLLEMERHIAKKHPKLMTCDVCDKKFTLMASLRRHRLRGNCQRLVERMNEERPFKCKFCPWSFSTDRNLRRHSAVHSRQQHFVCDKCPRAYKYADDLRSHTLHYH